VPEEQDRLREMEEWIIKDAGTWVLSESFIGFVGECSDCSTDLFVRSHT
jgi:hypothetical protein